MKQRTIEESFKVVKRFREESVQANKRSAFFLKAMQKELLLLEKKVETLKLVNTKQLMKNESLDHDNKSLICRIGDLKSTVRFLRSEK